jgi:hypothetical protein
MSANNGTTKSINQRSSRRQQKFNVQPIGQPNVKPKVEQPTPADRRVLIAIPTAGAPHPETVGYVIKMHQKIDAISVFAGGYPIERNRQNLVTEFLGRTQANWLFFLDDDVVPPMNSIEEAIKIAERLGERSFVFPYPLKLGLPDDPKKMGLLSSVVLKGEGHWMPWMRIPDSTFPVAAAGLGASLIHRSVFVELTNAGGPMFQWLPPHTYSPYMNRVHPDEWMGEDTFFYGDLRPLASTRFALGLSGASTTSDRASVRHSRTRSVICARCSSRKGTTSTTSSPSS